MTKRAAAESGVTAGAGLHWHFVTGSYAPELGGVADFTRQLAVALAAEGDEVHVWCPAGPTSPPADPGVVVHPLPGRFGREARRALDAGLDALPGPRRLLVQWVPHAFGHRSLNLPLAAWFWRRSALRGDIVDVVAHEGGLGFGEGGVRHTIGAVIHRLMALMVVRAARHVWVSTPEWARRWRGLAVGRAVDFRWLPIPSTVPRIVDEAGIAALRARLAPRGEPLVGHFGTFGRHHLPQLAGVFAALLEGAPACRLVLIGPGGERLADLLAAQRPEWRSRIVLTGALEPDALSRHISSMDLLVQPYTDGVTTRRTSAMAPLQHGRALVTTRGALTEPLWVESGAVALSDAANIAGVAAHAVRLLADRRARERLAEAGRALYEDRFDLRHAVAALRGGPSAVPPPT